MYDKFGEFDSVEELNRAAEAQKREGDKQALIILAAENGIDKEDAEDFYEECTEELATPLMAAVGKLNLEKNDLKLQHILSDWADEIIDMCMENEDLCKAVKKKGKDLAGYIALTAENGYVNRAIVDKRIVERTTTIKKIIGAHEFSIGIPDKKTRKELVTKYYLG